MKKNLVTIIIGELIICAVILLNTVDYVNAGNGQVLVPRDKEWVMAEDNLTRTGNYSYVLISVSSVYPTGFYENDNFQYCYTKLYHGLHTNVEVSIPYKLKEGQPYTYVHLKEGYVATSPFDIYFSGNDEDYAAYVVYNYYEL